MSKPNRRKHEKTDRRYRESRHQPYDTQYRNVYYIDQPPLPPPYYSQLPPPYYYAQQNGVLPQLPSNGTPPLTEKFYAKRPLVHVKTSDDDSETKGSKGKDEKKKTEKGGKKKLSFLKRISNGIVFGLETFFYKVGMMIACHPKKTIAVAVVVSCLLGIGMIRLETERDFAGLLVPANSRIHGDKAWVSDNIPYDPRPVQFVVESDNIISKGTLLAMHDLYNASFDIRIANGLGFTDFCNNVLGNCFVQSILSLWENDRTIIETLTEEEILEAINTTRLNPTYFTEFVPTEDLGSIHYDSDGRITRAEAAKMSFFLMANDTNLEQIKEFERQLLKLAEKEWNGIENLSVLTLESFRDEFFDSVYGDMILMLYIFPFVFVYMIFAMGKPNLVEHGLFLVLAAITGVMLSGLICYGICLAVGLSFGATHAGLIFLLMGIGVDDTFVVVETWKRVFRENPEKTLEEKMALTMKHAGVSVTVTSVSDFMAFVAGISTVMPILSSFCVYSAVGIFALFLIQSTFFPACVFLDQKRIQSGRDGCVPCYTHKNYKPNKYSNVEVLEPLFKKVWGRLILSIPGKTVVLLLSAGLLGTMSWSVASLQKGFDVERSLPADSSSRQFVIATEKHFPGNGYPFAVYCDTIDYFLYHKELERMENRYSNSTAVLDGKVTSWIRPFKMYLQYLKQFMRDPVVLDEDGFPADRETFNQYLYQFVHTSGFGDAYKAYIEMENNNETGVVVVWTIYRMNSLVDGDSDVNEKRLVEIREIADSAKTDGTCFAHGEFFLFAETSGYVLEELVRNLLLAGVSVFVVVLLLVVDLRSSFFVLLCVVFTTICLGGTLQFAGFMIEGTTVIFTTFCIGLSVDFSAHVAYMFMTVKGTRNERAQKTLEKIGPAILHGANSTLSVCLILSLASSHSMFLFFVTMISIMLYGLFAGLFLLPVILSLIGPDPYPDAENFKAPPFGHNWYNSELMPADRSWRIPRPQLKNAPDPRRREKLYYVSGSSNSAYQSSSDESWDRR